MGSLGKMPTGDRAMLTNEEVGQLPAETQTQYQTDISKAQMVGTNEAKMGEAWKKTSEEYSNRGATEKAALASKKSKDAIAASVDIRNTAIGDVNQKYRGVEKHSNDVY